MSARAVNQAADVIHRAQVNGAQTAAGIALALESAQLLQSLETVAEQERQLEAARVDGQRLIRAEQRRAELEAVLATHRRDDQAEIERLRKRVAELEAERHSTNEALDDAVKALREREARLAVSDGRVPFEYVDAHDQRIIINNKTTDARDQPYAWFQAEDLAIGGAMVNVWLPVAELERLDAALAARAGFEFTDHTGDSITVASGAEDWTVFTFTRCPDDEDDEEPTTVRVVVLTARVPQLRAALNLLRAEAGER